MKCLSQSPAPQVVEELDELGAEDLARRVLGGELSFSPVERTFPIWKTIRLGLYENSDGYRVALKRAQCAIGPWADDILDDVRVSTDVVDLVIVSVADLGFEEETCYIDICTKANELGLALCPHEVGPALRLIYPDQPENQWLYIAMEPMIDDGDERNIFILNNDHGELWLCSCPGDPEVFMSPSYHLVFMRPH